MWILLSSIVEGKEPRLETAARRRLLVPRHIETGVEGLHRLGIGRIVADEHQEVRSTHPRGVPPAMAGAEAATSGLDALQGGALSADDGIIENDIALRDRAPVAQRQEIVLRRVG